MEPQINNDKLYVKSTLNGNLQFVTDILLSIIALSLRYLSKAPNNFLSATFVSLTTTLVITPSMTSNVNRTFVVSCLKVILFIYLSKLPFLNLGQVKTTGVMSTSSSFAMGTGGVGGVTLFSITTPCSGSSSNTTSSFISILFSNTC